MTDEQLTEHEVLAAADHMIEAFGRSDTSEYFACFDESATFLFYYEPQRLNTRSEYERVWQTWMEQGVRVTSCISTDRKVQIAGSCALFLHDVESIFEQNGNAEVRYERETIVFARFPDGSIRSTHEHLSALPRLWVP